MALAVLTKLTGNSVLAAGVLYVVCVALTFSAVRRLVPSDDDGVTAVLWPLAITALIELNPIMVASAGLESALFVMLLAWLLVAAEARNALLFGVLAGALILTRPDGTWIQATNTGIGTFNYAAGNWGTGWTIFTKRLGDR